MLLQFSIGVADCLKMSCFYRFTMCNFHELSYTSFPFALKDGMWGLSLRKSSVFNQFTMCVFLELMLVFAYTSFPFGFDARLWGLIVT